MAESKSAAEAPLLVESSLAHQIEIIWKMSKSTASKALIFLSRMSQNRSKKHP